MKINEALEAVKLYKGRIAELSTLRSNNSHKEIHDYDMFRGREDNKCKIVVNEPMYDVKKVDKLSNKLSRELRVLEAAIKGTNAVTNVVGYEKVNFADVELGELEDFDRPEEPKK